VEQLPQSSVKPTFIVTCQYATLLFSIAPRTSLTWNQRRLRSVFDAFCELRSLILLRPWCEDETDVVYVYHPSIPTSQP